MDSDIEDDEDFAPRRAATLPAEAPPAAAETVQSAGAADPSGSNAFQILMAPPQRGRAAASLDSVEGESVPPAEASGSAPQPADAKRSRRKRASPESQAAGGAGAAVGAGDAPDGGGEEAESSSGAADATVIEVNPSSVRSGRLVLSKFAEATQSRELSTWSGATSATGDAAPLLGGSGGGDRKPKPKSQKGGAAAQPPAKGGAAAKGGIGAFFAKKGPAAAPAAPAAAAAEPLLGRQKKKKKADAEGKRGEAAAQARCGEGVVTLVLFEEVDVVFEDDAGFYAALRRLARESKCPMVATCNELSAELEALLGSSPRLRWERPSSAQLLPLAAALCLRGAPPAAPAAEVPPSSSRSLLELVDHFGGDVRRTVTTLQCWADDAGAPRVERVLGLESACCGAPLADAVLRATALRVAAQREGGGGDAEGDAAGSLAASLLQLQVGALVGCVELLGRSPLLEHPLRLLDAALGGVLLAAEGAAPVAVAVAEGAATVAVAPLVNELCFGEVRPAGLQVRPAGLQPGASEPEAGGAEAGREEAGPEEEDEEAAMTRRVVEGSVIDGDAPPEVMEVDSSEVSSSPGVATASSPSARAVEADGGVAAASPSDGERPATPGASGLPEPPSEEPPSEEPAADVPSVDEEAAGEEAPREAFWVSEPPEGAAEPLLRCTLDATADMYDMLSLASPRSPAAAAVAESGETSWWGGADAAPAATQLDADLRATLQLLTVSAAFAT
ncbi:hypothetical protein EMIHUDRAFT_118296, partial [Emiliania huxleyi CCMP1516]|uniref:ATPase AAA-type core domain-containing protein n=2 Tax=Emiliania huxleyi TaxID=2903 RepID=A0A0D3J5A8_EMIH1